jgi:dienelactone hydrolase
MAIQTQTVRYELAGKAYESLAVWDDAAEGPRPAVLVAPTFMGRNAIEDGKAERLAGLGFVGFSIDIYGVDTRPTNADEASAAMSALNGDRRALAAMMTAALEQARGLERVDAGRVAAIGFCFGGKCVLDLARTGADVKGVATFHGLFDPPPFETAATIPAKVLALHGWDDALAKPDAVVAFAAEMTAKTKDWQLHAYGHAEHGFTAKHRPQAYRPDADRRAWQALENFLGEIF